LPAVFTEVILVHELQWNKCFVSDEGNADTHTVCPEV